MQIWDIAKYARVTQSIIVYPPKHVVFLPRMVPSTEVEFVSTGKGKRGAPYVLEAVVAPMVGKRDSAWRVKERGILIITLTSQ